MIGNAFEKDKRRKATQGRKKGKKEPLEPKKQTSCIAGLGLSLIISKSLTLPGLVGANISWAETLTVLIPYSEGFYRHS